MQTHYSEPRIAAQSISETFYGPETEWQGNVLWTASGQVKGAVG